MDARPPAYVTLQPQGRRSGLMILRDASTVVALVLPFAGQAFPYGVPLFFPLAVLALMLSLLCAAWERGIGQIHLGSGVFPAIVLVTLGLFLYGLLLTQDWDVSLRSELLNAIGILFVWVAASNIVTKPCELERLARNFAALLLSAATVSALIGLYKFAVLLQGRTLAFVQDASPGRYPWGTSLTSDYNLYALTMLAGALVAASWLVERRGLVSRLACASLLLVLCVAGFLSGSRRFWVVAPVILFLMFIAAARRDGSRSAFKGLIALIAVIVASVLVLQEVVSADWDRIARTGWDLQYRLASLLDTGGTGGFQGRFVRWEFALELLSDRTVWLGNGFDYLRTFSCRFGDCHSGDYPHNALLSGLLYAGMAGMISVAVLFGYWILCAFKLLLRRPSRPVLAMLLLAHIPIVAISSNGPFAVKSALATAVLCALFADRHFNPARGRDSASALPAAAPRADHARV